MPEEDHIEVAVLARTIYLKPLGFATQQNSLGVPNFIDAMFRAGCTCVAVDLSECEGMDSTFLGVIAEAATASPHRPGKTLVVLNASAKQLKQLRRVGLMPLISVHEEPTELPGELRMQPLDRMDFPRTEIQKLRTVRRLHQRLVKLNERNKKLFGPFLEMLEEELQPQEEAPQQ